MTTADWDKISTESAAPKIKWIFNSPSAPWWGGFWERVVGLVKVLLRRVLGKASLDWEELETMLCDIERSDGVTDLDSVDEKSLNRTLLYKRELKECLRRRFRSEYLGQLVYRQKTRKGNHLNVGDVVLVGDDNRKRIDWKLGRIIELIAGRDGVERVAKLKTSNGELTRPIQKLFPLEVKGKEDPVLEKASESKEKVTRSGRIVKMPHCFME